MRQSDERRAEKLGQSGERRFEPRLQTQPATDFTCQIPHQRVIAFCESQFQRFQIAPPYIGFDLRGITRRGTMMRLGMAQYLHFTK